MTIDLLAMLTNDAPWQVRAACAESYMGDAFFPEAALWESDVEGAGGSSNSSHRQAAAAKQICNSICTVKAECAAYADLIGAKDGIWAGVDRGRKVVNQNSEKTHCPSGHAYDEENTRWSKSGRKCRACDRACIRTRRARDAA